MFCLERIRRSEAPPHPATYARMMQISLLAYLVAGTFLDMFYFDLTYHLVGLTVALETVALAATVRSPEEGQRPDVDESWWLRKPDGQFEVA